MTSRQTMWAALVVVLAPLAFEAMMGCQVIFPLHDQVAHNALRCDCLCAGGGGRDVPIPTSSDDAEQLGTATIISDTTLDLGVDTVGLRFPVVIPPGATITSAYVQFTAAANQSATTALTIAAEMSVTAATFSTATNDIGGRTFGAPLAWSPNPWSGGDTGLAQRTPELKAILQPVVDLPGWSDAASIVLRIDGTSGRRTARSFDHSTSKPPVLVLTYDTSVAAVLPVCALPTAERDSNGALTVAAMAAECSRAQDTLTGLAQSCGYPTSCTCDVVQIPDNADSFQSDVCSEPCVATPVDATCSNFDPNGFSDCLEDTGSVDACKPFVTATNAGDDSPVCVASGSPFAFNLFGRRTRCDVTGTSEIHVGDREPKQDPVTNGSVDLLGGPCAPGGCSVHPFLDLRMAPITFAVKFHSDPTFRDLTASGRGLQTAAVDPTGVATFPAAAVTGTGSGRRNASGLAITTTNASPLAIGIDWIGHSCTVQGNLATSVDGEVPEGVCDGDGTTVCTADSPDCDTAGGPCNVPASDGQSMTVDVTLAGTVVNEPPAAVAGPDQTLECTSTAGASFVLDGRGSFDPDHDLALARWRSGGRLGPEISEDLVARHSLGVGATRAYALLVIDSHAQTDLDSTQVSVVDTTPPVIACNAPATIRPRNAPISFVSTATDVCDASVATTVIAYDCFAFSKNKRVDKRSSCIVSFRDGTFTIRDSGGVGAHLQWTVRAADDSGNVRQVVCEVLVVK